MPMRPPCEEKERLLQYYRDAVARFASAVENLTGGQSPAEIERSRGVLFAAEENARNACLRALETHIRDHGC
jgi:hypothetical protein